uniref:Nucleolar complex protein 4 homolog isoform X2 n=1 Tax=Rhizophora mucronata TaxID=61149 RepID=A0A2P2M9J9_RHIMU
MVLLQEDGNDTAGDDSEAKRNDADDANASGTSMKTSPRKAGVDHFDNGESNPAKCNALRKCLSIDLFLAVPVFAPILFKLV